MMSRPARSHDSAAVSTSPGHRRWIARCLICLATALPGYSTLAQDGNEHLVPLFPQAGDEVRQGFVRVINHSRRTGEARIEAVDDDGVRFGPVTLAMDASETVHFNSSDLEEGNPAKGLHGGVGTGSGDWRLTLSSGLDLEVLSYIRTPADGFLTSMHDLVPQGDDGSHRVEIFNPGSNRDQQSRLRLINRADQDARVTIRGIDGTGASPGDDVVLTLTGGASRTIDAHELESGGSEFTGALGNGAGKWQLTIESDRTIHAMSLLLSPTGHLTNLSTAPSNSNADEGVHTVPMFPAASDPLGRQGFARVINQSAERVEVTISAFDDTDRDFGTSRLALQANETVHFNSVDLERGNAAKGLAGGTGAGEGDWRLELNGQDIEVLAYIRTTGDGFLTAMHDTVPREGRRHRVATFNPASNVNQASRLRLVNAGEEAAEVDITGIDGRGRISGGSATVTVPAGASSTLSAQALEAGGEGFVGELGDGAGKWQLKVDSDLPITVMSLLASPTGHLTNLSTAPSLDYAPANGAVFDDRVVGRRIATDDAGRYIDFPTPGRFRETMGSAVHEGDYNYTRKGPSEGTLVSEYDDGDRCTAELAFRSRTAATATSRCDDREAGELEWRVVEVPGGGVGGAVSAVYEVDDTVTTMPTGSWDPDRIGGGSVSASGGSVAISLQDGGFLEEGGYRYTCRSTGGCEVEGGVVKSGRVVETTIADVAATPDLIVDSASVNATAPIVAGGSMMVSATVRNQGSGGASSTTLRFYRSSNPTVSTGDVVVGSVRVGELAAADASAQSLEVTVPDEPGTYYFGVCADIVDGESDTRNNCSDSVDVTVESGNATVSMPDANLRAAVAAELGKASGEPITEADMATLTSLRAVAAGIDDLTGLESAVNLTKLYLNSNAIADLNPLAGLTALEALDLSGNDIVDISPLAGLTSLTSLGLASNAIVDITPLAGLTALTKRYLNSNAIADPNPMAGLTSLTSLTSLEALDLSRNDIVDISPLAGLTSLTSLDLAINSIVDITPLAGLTALTTLYLSHNAIADPNPLAGLTGLTVLSLTDNAIVDLSPLAGLTALFRLDSNYNNIVDLSPLAGLTALFWLSLDGNDIVDIAPLAGLTELSWLDLDNNAIVDLDPLAGLTGLSELYLDNNAIVDLNPLAGLTGLTGLSLSNTTSHRSSSANAIVDLTPLADLTALSRLSLSGNDVVDIAPLAGLTGLRWLTIHDNDISDLTALAGMTELLWLSFSGNPTAGLPALPGLRYLLLWGGSGVLDLSPLAASTGLTSLLILGDFEIRDLTPLAGLTELTDLSIHNIGQGSGISDLTPLADLTGLSDLTLTGQSIVDLTPLSGLTSLRHLDLQGSPITDLGPLAELTRLTTLNVPGPGIVDLTPLRNLTGLTRLSLGYNSVVDFSVLAELTELQALDISGSNRVDISVLAELPDLRDLRLGRNAIVDLTPLSGLAALELLDLQDNEIVDISPLSALPVLSNLWLDRNAIADLTPLSTLPALHTLTLRRNAIADLSPLSGLVALITLDLRDNEIVDLSPLSALPLLASLWLDQNAIADISPLAALGKLEILNLAHNDVTDISALANHSGLWSLSLTGNAIADASPLAALPGLEHLLASDNAIANLSPLSELTGLDIATLGNNAVSDLAPLVGNGGIGAGDFVELAGNPVAADGGNPDAAALRERGVEVVTARDGDYLRSPVLNVAPGKHPLSTLGITRPGYLDGACLGNATGYILGATRFEIRSWRWQRRADANSAWTDIAGTEGGGDTETRLLCPYTPVGAGEFRFAADMLVDGVEGKYSSNIISQ